MLTYTTLTAADAANTSQKERVVDFLFHHLGKYGDKKEDILKAIDYALSDSREKGGFVLVAEENNEIVGTVVMNRTGMNGYIPDNILVYIATHENQRGKGIGRALMQRAMNTAEGDIALHVEPDNPAKRLYDRLGFTNKYLEMRFRKDGQQPQETDGK